MRRYMKSVVGNDALCERLCRDVLSNKLSHAYIIEGADGTGKHLIAYQTAAALACTRKSVQDGNIPCGECPECRKILGGKSPDVIVVNSDGKATIGVDTVRFIREDCITLPNDLDFKLYIIEDADKMTDQAQNALLLTLEEPPSFVRFMLLCENATSLLETVRSRAPILRTMGVPQDELDKYICEKDPRAAQMKLSSPAEYAELIAASKNGIGRALEFLDARAFAPTLEVRRLAYKFIETATSGAKREELFSLLPVLAPKKTQRDLFARQLETIALAASDLTLLKKDDRAPLTFFSDRAYALEICERCSINFLYDLTNAVLNAQESNSRSANVRLTVIKMFADANLI